MEEISSAIVNFVKTQPQTTQHKYVSFIEAATLKNEDTFINLVDSGFSRTDLKHILDEISKVILDKFPFETVLTKLK